MINGCLNCTLATYTPSGSILCNTYLKPSHIPWITSILQAVLITFHEKLQEESKNERKCCGYISSANDKAEPN